MSFIKFGSLSIHDHGDDASVKVWAAVPHDARREVAQEIAGDEWQIAPKAGALPPPYLLDDLWQALGGDPADFDEWHAQHGSANTWGQLLAIVRRQFRPVCGKPVDGEFCVLTRPLHGAEHICHGPSDVGMDELPPIPAAQLDRPEPIDPAAVKVGDVVEVEAADGSWLVRGEVKEYGPQYELRLAHSGDRADWIQAGPPATVRLVRRAEPEPDPEQVEVLWNLGHQLGASRGEPLLSHDEAAELIRRGVTVRKDT